MPISNNPKTFNRCSPIELLKRFLVLASVMAVTIFAVDQLSLNFTALGGGLQNNQDRPERNQPVREDCSFVKDPEGVKGAMARHRDEVARSTEMISQAITSATDEQSEIALVPPQEIPRKNYIDNFIFDKMARDSVISAPLCSDSEFVRRAYLDLTGRIPAATDVTSFASDTSANKRDALVDKLIGSPEYIDKWTMFFGDLFKNNSRSTQVQRYSGGRDAFYTYIKNSITANKSYAQMASEMISANGDNFVNGEANFIVGGNIAMGPVQDTMDGRAVNTASMFIGINAVDCLLCHNGAGHLDSVNLWGSKRLRSEAWGMSAFFARVRTQRQSLSQQPNYAKFIISESGSGEYMLNTDFGNRTARQPVDGKNTVAPKYILSGAGPNQGEDRRKALARLVTTDLQFARAAVNYIWEKMMVEGLVSPSNTFDPDRLSATAQLPQGWTPQPANPELLEALAQDFVSKGYNIRILIATIAKSNAYQLSTQYPGTWSLALLPYYARKYVRRLDAEEIHDAILKATGIGASYQLRDALNQPTWTVNWAMQLPDTSEPRGNTNTTSFLNQFIRGDRDVKPRSQEPSIQQALSMMNNSLVMTRIHQNNAGSTVATLLANTALTPAQLTTQLYLNTLSRNPSQSELDKLTPLFTSMSRQNAAEAVQWALINKMDFIFNY